MSSVTKLLGDNFPNLVSDVCLSKFESLGKTGKPKDDGEYTLLACIVKRDTQDNLEVVSLGTGSKCIGASLLPSNGDVLHDSHAEVIARRAFLFYLICEIDRAESGGESIFRLGENGKFDVLPGITFHFYSSHTPCGDASIFAKQEWTEDCCGEEIKMIKDQIHKDSDCSSKKRLSDVAENAHIGDSNEPPFKKHRNIQENEGPPSPKQCLLLSPSYKEMSGSQDNAVNATVNSSCDDSVEECDTVLDQSEGSCSHEMSTGDADIHRTGAKCVMGEKEDPKAPGVNYHITGALRTKPGRGDPTLSLSCSDKIFKWTILGVQGALLMQFLEKPIYLQSITIGCCPYSQEAMERAVFGRFKDSLNNIQLPFGFRIATPNVFLSSTEFQYSRFVVTKRCLDVDKVKPSPCSLIWSLTDFHSHKHEVSVNGSKLGTTRKNLGTPKSWVSICRQALLQRILSLMRKTTKGASEYRDKNYAECKQFGDSYQKAWATLKDQVLHNWTSKPAHTKDFKPESQKEKAHCKNGTAFGKIQS